MSSSMSAPDAPDSVHVGERSGGIAGQRDTILGGGHPIVRVVAFALAIRLVSALLAFFSNAAFPLDQREQFTVFGRSHVFWDAFARYDSGWYWGIARDGYHFVDGGRNNLAFFPVYPMTMRLTGDLIGGRPRHFIYAGIVASWVMFAIGLVMFHRLAREDLGDEAAWRAVVLASVFPFAFFFGVVYSESTFFALIVTSFFGFRTQRWWLGGVAGALAVCTRVNGIMALPALAWLAWQAAGRDRVARLRAAAALGMICAAFGAWCVYVYTLSGSPFEWASSIQRWNYHPGGNPLAALFRLVYDVAAAPYTFIVTNHAAPYDLLNGFAALVACAAVPFVWRRFGTAYAMFMLLNLALPLSSGQLEGLGRYCSVLFPVSLWLASFPSPHLHSTLVASSAMAYLLCLALFTNLHPIF